MESKYALEIVKGYFIFPDGRKRPNIFRRASYRLLLGCRWRSEQYVLETLQREQFTSSAMNEALNVNNVLNEKGE